MDTKAGKVFMGGPDKPGHDVFRVAGLCWR